MRKRHERRSREQWSAIIEDQATSGLSIADYCQSNNIGLASFAKWKRRLRSDATKPSHSKQSAESFASVKLIEPNESQATVTLSIGTNITLTINSPGPMA